MALKRIITANRFITLRPHQAEAYVEQADGTYLLEIEEPDGSLAPPPPKPEDVAGLKSALQKIKAERDDTRNQLREVRDALASDDSTGTYRAVLEKRLEELLAREATNQAEHDAALKALAAEYEPKLAAANAKHQAVLAEGDELVLEHTLEKTIHDAHGISTFLLPKLKKFCRVIRDEDDAIGKSRRVGVFDDDGSQRKNADGAPVSVAQALEELKSFDPLIAATCFEPSGSNGNGNGAPH